MNIKSRTGLDSLLADMCERAADTEGCSEEGVPSVDVQLEQLYDRLNWILTAINDNELPLTPWGQRKLLNSVFDGSPEEVNSSKQPYSYALAQLISNQSELGWSEGEAIKGSELSGVTLTSQQEWEFRKKMESYRLNLSQHPLVRKGDNENSFSSNVLAVFSLIAVNLPYLEYIHEEHIPTWFSMWKSYPEFTEVV